VPAHIPARQALAYLTAFGLLFGGLAIQAQRFARVGAIVLGFLYLVFGALWLPRVVAYPQIFGTWGGVFEQLSLVAAAMVIYASVEPNQEAESEAGLGQAGRILYGVCAVVFGLNHFFAIPETANMVPKWIPPGPYFWAVGTGVAHLLAGVSILSGILARTASRLLTLMLLLFGVLVWLPSLRGHTQEHMVWSGNAINLVMAGAAWVIADWIAAGRAVGARTKSFRAVSAA
jgi:uncharacterized membrane protein YphA (DoxX/SURF4 family)